MKIVQDIVDAIEAIRNAPLWVKVFLYPLLFYTSLCSACIVVLKLHILLTNLVNRVLENESQFTNEGRELMNDQFRIPKWIMPFTAFLRIIVVSVGVPCLIVWRAFRYVGHKLCIVLKYCGSKCCCCCPCLKKKANKKSRHDDLSRETESSSSSHSENDSVNSHS